jgi:DNA topoisomerase I
MARYLVIVESPAKAGTIGKYLGPDYQVLASMGHVRDLPNSKMGVDTEAGFAPSYVVPLKAKPTIKKIKEALKGKEAVYLASDLDREGESISWHIAQALSLDTFPGRVHRITFDEITKAAITNAVANPRDIDQQLVDAQQARRVLDRLVGYTLSPLLWKKILKGLSAGRVQSVALRMIVDREAERNAFNPVEYWSIIANLDHALGSFTAKLVQYDGKKIEQMTIGSQTEADAIFAALQAAAYQVISIDQKPVKRRPNAPYTTSTFQQDAVNRLGMSSKSAMRAAQQLYEGGHITYMRTDSVDLGSEAIAAIRSYVTNSLGVQYIPEKPNYYTTKSKGAQEAHEAIRPTNPQRTGSDLHVDPTLTKVYDLIRRRTIASQMAEAQLLQTALTIQAGPGQFRANGQVVTFPGFYAIMPPAKKDDDDGELPNVQVNDQLACSELKKNQHFTEPPPRFSEATLIKALEEFGIGRPSTYAPTIDTLVQRNYVVLEQRRFTPEEIGTAVIALLKEHFPNIVDTGFTASMEEQLDQIAEGKGSYQEILTNFWGPFKEQVDTETEKIQKVSLVTETDKICPTCGKPMVIRIGRFGKFLACSNFPECKTTQPLEAAPPTGMICPIDGKDFAWKRARKGMFLGCSGYPECKCALWKPDQLPKKIAELEVEGTALPFKEQALAAFAALPKELTMTAAKSSYTKKPATKKPVTKKPVAKKPATKNPATKAKK